MITINPYFTFNGNCEEAFEFYKSVFGGQFPYIGRYKDMPQDADHPLADSEQGKIMHMSLPISKETVLMGADSCDAFGQASQFGDNISLCVNCDTMEEVDNLFAKLSVGGTVTMPLDKTFWGEYFGMLIDKYQINWMFRSPIK